MNEAISINHTVILHKHKVYYGVTKWMKWIKLPLKLFQQSKNTLRKTVVQRIHSNEEGPFASELWLSDERRINQKETRFADTQFTQANQHRLLVADL